MIRPAEGFIATCARCGRRTTDDWPGAPMVYANEEQANEHLIHLGWWSADPLDDIAVCPPCREQIDAEYGGGGGP